MQWKIDPSNPPGPIQLSRVRKALNKLSAEHNTSRTLRGVIGLKDGSYNAEHSSSSFILFGATVREDVKAVQDKLHTRFNSTITRSNVNDLTVAIESELPKIIEDRPTKDERITPEQHAANEVQRAADRAERERQNAEQQRAQRALLAQKQSAGTQGTVKLNDQLGGVEIHFPAKPTADVISRLKSNGFRWSMRSRCWYKKQSEYAIKVAYEIAGAAKPTDMGVPPVATPAGQPSQADPGPDRFDMHVEDTMAAACGL